MSYLLGLYRHYPPNSFSTPSGTHAWTFFTWLPQPTSPAQCLLPSILAGFTTDRLVAQKRSKCGPKPIHLSLAKNGPIFPSKFIPIFQWEQRHVTKSPPGKKWVVQLSDERGHSQMTSAKLWNFWTPSPSSLSH